MNACGCIGNVPALALLFMILSYIKCKNINRKVNTREEELDALIICCTL